MRTRLSRSGTMNGMDSTGIGGFARIADLPDDSSREKEVYARYGLAMFYAHTFEQGLITLIMAHVIAVHHQAGDRGGAEAFRELTEDLYSRTAGNLLARLRERPGLTEPLDDLLREAIGVRNRLAHHWFREHGLEFASVEGMQAMVDDLDRAMETFRVAGSQAFGLAVQTFISLGIDEADIDRVREHLANAE
jgi:hypothetical protein